jgi:hypothetical protein
LCLRGGGGGVVFSEMESVLWIGPVTGKDSSESCRYIILFV